jgi:hypothetical protein
LRGIVSVWHGRRLFKQTTYFQMANLNFHKKIKKKKHMMALRAKIFEYKDQNIRRRTQKTFFYGPNNMEPLNIPYIADTTISGGTFQTPILQNIFFFLL